MDKHLHILAKSEKNGQSSLYHHLKNVETAALKIAEHFQLDAELVRTGAILHDIGKAHPVFQKRLGKNYDPTWEPFRHEIASLLFLPMLNPDFCEPVIEMVAAHHKSPIKDSRDLGIVDLYERYECDGGELYDQYYANFEKWSEIASDLLTLFHVKYAEFDKEESCHLFYSAVNHCREMPRGWSQWKGVLVAADQFASALDSETETLSSSLFKAPDLSFYNRQSKLHPLSMLPAESSSPHSLVAAPTGAGKTDYLLRRCRKRIFYTLPFQASINAMYKRLQHDLQDTDADIRLLHSTSELIIENGKYEERVLQGLVGASIKVLTPHQLASIVFGTRGYETLLLDLQGNDVILDEIHTYTRVSQAIVIELVKILKAVGCRLHIGTATMPTSLKQEILKILQDVHTVELPPNVLDSFDRHVVHLAASFDETLPQIEQALSRNEKVLIVANRVKHAQDIYQQLQEYFPDVKSMLLHSRFKRADRAQLEQTLTDEINSKSESCIVVSTQVVEVSLDISFDLMVTDCAPLDSLIQRFGRINRRRTNETIGKLRPVYVCAPPNSESDALPYDLKVLQSSFEALPKDKPLKEREIQTLLDKVYPHIDITPIASHVIYRHEEWVLKKLVHRPKSVLMDILDIESAVCICESDQDEYLLGNKETRISLEIPVSFRSIAFKELNQLKTGNRPFVIPDTAYHVETGINMQNASPAFYSNNFI